MPTCASTRRALPRRRRASCSSSCARPRRSTTRCPTRRDRSSRSPLVASGSARPSAIMTDRQLHRRLATFYFAYFLMLGGIAPFFSLYLNKLGFTGVEIGTLLALMPLARVIAPPAWGWLADHHGSRRPLVRKTTAAAALSCAGLLFAQSYGSLFVVILLLNIFWCAAL